MIKAKVDGALFEIDDDFNVSCENKKIEETSKKLLDVYFKGWAPEDGDQMLSLASDLKKLGFEIIEATSNDSGVDEFGYPRIY